MTNLLIKKIKAHIAEFNKSNVGFDYYDDMIYTAIAYDKIMQIIENHETLENANKYDQN